MNNYYHCFFVEYIDENGIECAECLSEYALNLELKRKEIIIKSVSLDYQIKVALGMEVE